MSDTTVHNNLLEKISNPKDLVGTKFITPKDLNEVLFFPKGKTK